MAERNPPGPPRRTSSPPKPVEEVDADWAESNDADEGPRAPGPPKPPRKAATLVGGTPGGTPRPNEPSPPPRPPGSVAPGPIGTTTVKRFDARTKPGPPPAPPRRTAPAATIPAGTPGVPERGVERTVAGTGVVGVHPSTRPAAHAPVPREEPPALSLAEEIARHAERIKSSDPVGAARALVELGILEERVNQDRAAARKAYEAARKLVRTLEPALTRFRRLLEGPSELTAALGAIDDEITVAGSEAVKADLLAERARVLEQLGRLSEARASYTSALGLVTLHPAALHGLEAVLRKELVAKHDKKLAEELASHAERLATAYAPAHDRQDGDARLSAWVLVERAAVLDGPLASAHSAQASLERAVALDPGPGPVRDAYTRHLVLHARTKELAASLSIEAEAEPDGDRASRLLYTSARLLSDELDLPMEATNALSRALMRTTESTPTARRIDAELIRLLEASGDSDASSQVRVKRLSKLTEPGAIAHEHIRLSEIFDALGKPEESAIHAELALQHAPADGATRERLDRALQRLGRHDERVRSWVFEGNADRPVPVRIAALMRAADIADRNLKRREEALGHLRAAWAIEPGNTTLFDALSGLLAPTGKDVDADPRGVRARIDLYVQAAQATQDPARRVALYEKLASIWEDELGQPARAIEALERVLTIEPKRRTAILALQRNAERAGDGKQLAKAISAEADLTTDPALQRSLLLRAAEVHDTRLNDRDRAMVLVDRALALDANNVEALRARFRLLERSNRYSDARKALVNMIGRESDEERRFALWVEVAILDEQRLKKPHDAVEAYTQAAAVKPRHPLPPREIVRLLREAGEPERLVKALIQLAGVAADQDEYARLLFQAAEVQERMLRDDDAALKCLQQADGLPDAEKDPAILEAIERILLRKKTTSELAGLYRRWLERQPPASVDHGLRIALANTLTTSDPAQAVGILDGLVGVVPSHIPALRSLQHLNRRLGAHAALGNVLRSVAEVVTSRLARSGALWEIVGLEDHVGQAAALEALVRLAGDTPSDTAALDGIVRVAGKLTTGVAVPHPAAIATRARLVPALSARKELTRDPASRALYELEEAILAETSAPEDQTALRTALAGYQAALLGLSDSLLAARGLERLADKLGDRPNLVLAQRALARLVGDAAGRARHLVRAATLTAEDPKAQGDALALFEEALATDADSTTAAQSVARMLAGDYARLADRLGQALESATIPDQIVLLGVEIGRAFLRHRDAAGGSADAGSAIGAMRRVLRVLPNDGTALLLLARLLVAQHLWAEARDALRKVIERAEDGETRLTGLFMLADVFENGLGDLREARGQLEAVLHVDDKNRRALDRLYQIAVAQKDTAYAVHTLGRLADTAGDATGRVDADLKLADLCREIGDSKGSVRALCDAVASAPADLRPWTALSRLWRVETPDGAAQYAAALQQVLDIASTRRIAVDPRWLTTLGLLEVSVLVRPGPGLAHLQQAAALPGAPTEARVALGRGLEAAGRNSEAAQVLREILTADPDTFARLGELGVALTALESALAKDGRVEERLAVEEVRGSLGEVKADRMARLRARRLPDGVPYAQSVTGAEMGRLLVPEARCSMIDVAVAIAPVAAKILRFELSSLGVSSRDRIGPRDGHPTRVLADRIALALGIDAFELYFSPSWQGAARIYPGDPPAIVGPASFVELPEPEQAFAFGRLLTRMALGMTWLDELPVDAADGLLLASVRAVDPGFGSGELSVARDTTAQNFSGPVGKALGRRQRKMLEEIAPTAVANYDARGFSIGLRRSEYRIAYVLSGDLISAIDYLRRFDREIARSAEEPRVLLQHPVTNELLRYALTAESYAERRRVGVVWSG